MPDRMDPATRQRVTAAGARALNASLTDAEREQSARQAARAAHAPATLARRIAKAWPELDDAERREVRAILRAGGIVR